MAEPPRGPGRPNNAAPEGGAEGAPFVRNIVKDPANVPDVMRLYGYAGASSEANHERLYLSPDLSAYVEIPADAVLHRMAVPQEQDPQGAVVLWVRQDAALKQKTSPASSALAHYFAGALQAAAGAGTDPMQAQAQALPATLPQALCPPSPACSLPQALCGRTPVLPCPHPSPPHICPPPSPPVVCLRTPVFPCPPPSPPLACPPHTPPVVCQHSPPLACPPTPPIVCLRTPHAPCFSVPNACVSVQQIHCPLPQAMAQPEAMMAQGMAQPGAEAMAFTVQVNCPTHPAVCLHTPVIVCPPISPPILCQHSPFVACHPTLINCPVTLPVHCPPRNTPFCPTFDCQSLACPSLACPSLACPSLACGGGFGGGGFGTM